jgi:hypothetical protein
VLVGEPVTDLPGVALGGQPPAWVGLQGVGGVEDGIAEAGRGADR